MKLTSTFVLVIILVWVAWALAHRDPAGVGYNEELRGSGLVPRQAHNLKKRVRFPSPLPSDTLGADDDGLSAP